MTAPRLLQRLCRPLTLTALAMATLAGCENTAASPASQPAMEPREWRRVELIDQGLGMVASTMAIPAQWTLSSDIATHPETGLPQRQRLEVHGPGGEAIISLGTESYMAVLGGTRQQTLTTLLQRGVLGTYTDLELGAFTPSAALERSSGFQRARSFGESQGYRADALEAPIRAHRNGTAVVGRLYVNHLHQTSPQGPMGMISATAVLSPPARLEPALAINLRMAESIQPNEAHTQRIAAVGAAYRQRQSAAFDANLRQRQATLRQREAAFQASQQAVRERSAQQDRNHQRYLETVRGSGNAPAGGSGYTQHDQFIDGIYERSSFDDPHSGQRTTRDGYHDHWYQDNRGNYLGTDDPNYRPPNDWERIEPLKPGR